MRIVFVGCVEFSKRALLKTVESEAEVVGVVTRESSAFNTDFCDLSGICRECEIPYLYSEDINSKESIEWIKVLNPDYIFCFGWSFLLKRELLNLPKKGVIGYHPAMLPKNRGRHPIVWALSLGLESTGSTFFFMDEGADSGDILSQERLFIGYDDDAASLYAKLNELALKQIESFIPELINNSFSAIPQEHKMASYWRKRGKRDGKIDWRMSSRSIYNLVRALTKPYVGAHFEYKGEEISVWKVSEVEEIGAVNIEPGKVIKTGDGYFTVKSGDSFIKVLDYNPRIEIEAGDYL